MTAKADQMENLTASCAAQLLALTQKTLSKDLYVFLHEAKCNYI